MTIEITANNIIDTLISEFDEMESFYNTFTKKGKRIYKSQAKGRKWTYYGNDFEQALQSAYYHKERAEAKIYAVADALSVHYSVVWETVLNARRWYNRTEWKYCLSEHAAAGLWALAVTNNKR